MVLRHHDRIGDIFYGHKLEQRVVVQKFIKPARTDAEARDDLARMQRLVTPGDHSLFDEIQDGVGYDVRVNAEIAAVTEKPVWVTEVGVSSFGSEEVQAWGVKKTAELLIGRAPRLHWYSLYDLPKAWPATTRHREAEGSSYYRHFYMGLVKEDGTPKRAARCFAGSWKA